MASLYKDAKKRKASEQDKVVKKGGKAAVSSTPSADVASSSTAAPTKNKQRVLLLPSRGVTQRMRHLVNDLEALMPHCKKESKLDSKSDLSILNELAELNNCNNALYFEARKHEDLYLWASKTPNGPSMKMHVQNIHTMDELKMTGNCLKGSRPLLSFDKSFDDLPHFALIKEMFTQIFGVPRLARRSKPFVDHVISFSVLDNKIWFRNYQIVEKDGNAIDGEQKKRHEHGEQQPTLVEIGPRMVLTPIRIFEGSFGGATLFENDEYVSPNTLRHDVRRQKGEEYKDKTHAAFAREAKRQKLQREAKTDELGRDIVFA